MKRLIFGFMGTKVKFTFVIVVALHVLFKMCNAGEVRRLNGSTTFLYTDRHCYVSGDILFLKGFSLPRKSQNIIQYENSLLIDLVSTQGTLISYSTLELKNFMVDGLLSIPDTVATGEYVLRASKIDFDVNYEKKILFEKKIYITNRFGNNGYKTTDNLHDLKYPTDSLLKTRINGDSQYAKLRIIDKTNTRTKVNGSIEVNSSNILGGTVSVKAVSLYESYYDSVNSFSFQLNPSVNQKFKYRPNKSGIIISGKVLSKSNQEPKSGVVVMVNKPDSLLNFRATITDSTGSFRLLLYGFYGKEDMYFTCFSYPNFNVLNNVKVELDNRFYNKTFMNPFDEFSYEQSADTTNVLKATINKAYEIIPVSKKTVSNVAENFEEQYLLGLNKQTINIDDFVELDDFAEIIREIVPYTKLNKNGENYKLTIINPKNGLEKSNPIVFVDGVPLIDLKKILKWGSKKLDKIEIVNESRIYGNINFQSGLVFISTKNQDFWTVTKENNNIITIEGFQNDYKINFPNYRESRNSNLPDFRSILYWNPEVEIIENNSFNFEFYTSDEKGWFEVNFIGITENYKLVKLKDFIYIE